MRYRALLKGPVDDDLGIRKSCQTNGAVPLIKWQITHAITIYHCSYSMVYNVRYDSVGWNANPESA